MSETTTIKTQPTHRAYNVTGEGDNAKWNEIGAAWAHKDGKGFNLFLNCFPIDGKATLRVNEPKPKAE